MQNFDREGLENINDEAGRAKVTEAGAFEEPGFFEVHNAFDKFMLNEARSDSEARLMEPGVNDALEAYAKVRPDLRPLMEPEMVSAGVYEPMFYKNKALLKQLEPDILRDREKYPDAGLSTLSELMKQTEELTTEDRERALQSFANSRGMARAGMLTGTMTGIITDPLILATLPMGAGAITGSGVAGNAFRAFKVEALIAGASESLIQPQVYNWKKEINSPYSVQEAAFNIVTAAVGAGLIRGTGSAVMDVVEIRNLAKLKREQGGKAAETEADILDRHAEDIEAADGNTQEHFDSLDQAINDLDRGAVSKSSNVAEHVEALDPNDILVDATQFQFKAGTDAEGVSNRLKGVERWDPKMAGIAIVYENNGGQRFIVDGHQRVALAKRMIASGQAAEEVNLNAIILRESDGVSVGDARQIAAVKNIAEGTGSAVDTAKVLRELGDSGLDLMPSLPPNSALVRAGRGLSQLDDEAFSMVINGVVDEKVGALVGELIVDATEQRAVIAALSEADPSNLVQARIMINDMKAAGFQKTETQDLFGGQEVAESLFKERAKILDNTLKRLRQDKAAFKTLERKAGEITGEGNILNRAANTARISDDEKTLANITALANTKGEISDALNDAATRLKEGESVSKVTEDFLGAIRAKDAQQPGERVGAGGVGQAGEAVEFKKGKPVRLDEVAEGDRKAVETEFKSKQQGQTLDDIYKTASTKQGQLTRMGNAITKDLGDDNVQYLNPGIKKRADAETKVEKKYSGDASHVTDVIRGGFLVRTIEDAEKIAESIAKKFEVMDEYWSVTAAGYYDRKIMVRFADGKIGEIQIWEPHALLAKEGKKGLNFIPEKWIDKAQTVLDNDKSGHGIYEKARKLLKDGVIPPENMAAYKALEAESAEVFADANRLANRDWNTLIETRRPSSLKSTGETLDQVPGSTPSGTKKPDIPDSDSTVTAGRPSQSSQAVTSDGEKGVSMPDSIAEREVITKGDLFGDDTAGAQAMHDARLAVNAKLNPDDHVDIGAGPGDLFSGKANQLDIEDAVDLEIYEADLDIPVGTKLDEDGKIVAETKGAREVYDEIDEQADAINNLEGCYLGAA